MSLSTKNSKSNNKTNNNKIICNFCNRKGHLESKCFRKYPNLAPNNKSKNINLVEEIGQIPYKIGG